MTRPSPSALVPVVMFIGWYAGEVAACFFAGLLDHLLVYVVARFAERLPVVLVPEELLIIPVWLDVIDYGCLDVLPALEVIGA
jgi:hypothetical protein